MFEPSLISGSAFADLLSPAELPSSTLYGVLSPTPRLGGIGGGRLHHTTRVTQVQQYRVQGPLQTGKMRVFPVGNKKVRSKESIHTGCLLLVRIASNC